jgi:hypothetical protein
VEKTSVDEHSRSRIALLLYRPLRQCSFRELQNDKPHDIEHEMLPILRRCTSIMEVPILEEFARTSVALRKNRRSAHQPQTDLANTQEANRPRLNLSMLCNRSKLQEFGLLRTKLPRVMLTGGPGSRRLVTCGTCACGLAFVT